MELTHSGYEMKFQIVSYIYIYIYQYLKLLRDTTPKKWVKTEGYTVLKNQFQSLDFDGTLSTRLFAKTLSANMLDYPMKHVLSGPHQYASWTPGLIQSLLVEYFIPRNMRLILHTNLINTTTTDN